MCSRGCGSGGCIAYSPRHSTRNHLLLSHRIERRLLQQPAQEPFYPQVAEQSTIRQLPLPLPAAPAPLVEVGVRAFVAQPCWEVPRRDFFFSLLPSMLQAQIEEGQSFGPRASAVLRTTTHKVESGTTGGGLPSHQEGLPGHREARSSCTTLSTARCCRSS